MEFKIGDMLVFADESGSIHQDGVCKIADCYIICNKYVYDIKNNEIANREFICEMEEIKEFKGPGEVKYYRPKFLEDGFYGHDKHLDWKLKEIWTKTDEDVYKKVWELRSLEEYEYTMNYFYKEYQRDIELGCDEVDLAKSRRAYEQAKKEYEQAKKIWENK